MVYTLAKALSKDGNAVFEWALEIHQIPAAQKKEADEALKV